MVSAPIGGNGQDCPRSADLVAAIIMKGIEFFGKGHVGTVRRWMIRIVGNVT
jgi:hypothetical protein